MRRPIVPLLALADLVARMYQTSIGAHIHRSGRGAEKIHLPAEVEPLPVLFKKSGYYMTIGGPLAKR